MKKAPECEKGCKWDSWFLDMHSNCDEACRHLQWCDDYLRRIYRSGDLPKNWFYASYHEALRDS